MTVRVTERDDAHLSHEAVADGIQIWTCINRTNL